MSESEKSLIKGFSLRRVGSTLLVTLVFTTVVFALFGPAVGMELMGDSYHFVHLAHSAAHNPVLLFSDIGGFFRQSATWLLVMDRVFWGGFDPRGYHLTSLMLHILTSVLLWAVTRRLGFGELSAALISIIWATSPFLSECVVVVASRSQHLLLAPWLVMILLWPRAGESWHRLRLIGVGMMILLAAAAKETWVVTPGLVFALELGRNLRWRQALRSAMAVGVVVAIYLVAYSYAEGTGNPYFEIGWYMLARIPVQMANFLYLEEPMPFSVSLSWQSGVAFVIMAVICISSLRWRSKGTWVALALLILPTIPTLAVPYMPMRYLVIPYAGFLLLVAGWLTSLVDRNPRWKKEIVFGVLGVSALTMVAGVTIVRADLEDYRSIAGAHGRLLEEARVVAPEVTGRTPVAVVRDERESPLVEILREPKGFAKLPYTRHAAPYGLIDSAMLFEWVIAKEGTLLEPVEDWESSCQGVEGLLMVHTEKGFIIHGRFSDLALECNRWLQAGRRLQVIHVIPD